MQSAERISTGPHRERQQLLPARSVRLRERHDRSLHMSRQLCPVSQGEKSSHFKFKPWGLSPPQTGPDCLRPLISPLPYSKTCRDELGNGALGSAWGVMALFAGPFRARRRSLKPA